MKIKKIEIKGLWKTYDINWELDDKVNILSGSNGSGKTTVLDIVASLLYGGKVYKTFLHKVSAVTIHFTDDYSLKNVNFDDSYLNLKKEAKKDYVLKELEQDVTDEIKPRDKNKLNNLVIQASISSVEKSGKKIEIKNFLELLNLSIISTFDTYLPNDEDTSKLSSLRKDGVKSSLDKELHDLQEKYSYYLAELAYKLEKAILKDDSVNTEFVKDLYKQKNLFISIVNDFFEETNKKINVEKSKLEFLLKDEIYLSIYDLSSGEKQLLYILLKILLQEKKECIVFMDEPEISLHVDWQEILIKRILELNPNCQLLIASHSPSLILQGWDAKVKNMNDIIL